MGLGRKRHKPNCNSEANQGLIQNRISCYEGLLALISSGLRLLVPSKNLAFTFPKRVSFVKKRPSQMIVDIYRTNRDRLSAELEKDVKDRSTNNAIAAYSHIVSEMETAYDLSFV